MTPIRTVIVDDHVMLRDGIVSILDRQPDFEVVGEAGSVAEAIKTVLDAAPDLVLMDFGLPDGNGLDAAREILSALPQTDVVILTMHEEDDLLFSAVRTGAKGYLLKNISAQDMLSTLRKLSQGDVAMLPAERMRILSEFARTAPQTTADQTKESLLTSREVEVMELIVVGATNREIAQQLHIAPNTVKNHVHNILEKLQVADRHEAAQVAIKQKLVSADRP